MLRCITYLQDLLSVVSGILGDSIAADAPLMEAGLDSLGAVEVRNAVASKFGVEVPATITFDYPSVRALAGFVLSKMATPKDPQASSTAHIILSSQQSLRIGSMPKSGPYL